MKHRLTMRQYDELAGMLETYYAGAREDGDMGRAFFDSLEAVISDCRQMRHTDPRVLPDEEDGGRDGRTRDRTMLDDIFGHLDGEEWNSDTTAAIGEIFTDAGWTIHEPGFYDG